MAVQPHQHDGAATRRENSEQPACREQGSGIILKWILQQQGVSVLVNIEMDLRTTRGVTPCKYSNGSHNNKGCQSSKIFKWILQRQGVSLLVNIEMDPTTTRGVTPCKY